MEKGFKKLNGVRVILSLPPRDTKGIELSPELKEELDREYAAQLDKLEVYAIGDAVEGIKIGDVVYVPTEELKRGTFVTINEESKLIVNSMAIALVW
jgi:predicted transcriptional regulator